MVYIHAPIGACPGDVKLIIKWLIRGISVNNAVNNAGYCINRIV